MSQLDAESAVGVGTATTRDVSAASVPVIGQSVGAELKAAVQATLAALEQAGVSERDADEFVRDCAFEAWWDWDYEGPSDA